MLIMSTSCMFGESGGSYTKPEALAGLLEKKNEPYILLDVRTPEEYASGHIPSALNIPYDRLEKTPPTDDKKALIIVYCRSGNRAGIAKKILNAAGYVRVEDFGAIGRWNGALVTGDKP